MKLFSTIGLNLQVENSQSLSTWMVLNVPRFSPRPPCTNGVTEKSIKIARCIGEARFGGGESTREWLFSISPIFCWCTALPYIMSPECNQHNCSWNVSCLPDLANWNQTCLTQWPTSRNWDSIPLSKVSLGIDTCWFVVIVRVKVVFRKTVVGDWCFDYLSSSHLQSQVKSRHRMMVFMPLVLVW